DAPQELPAEAAVPFPTEIFTHSAEIDTTAVASPEPPQPAGEDATRASPPYVDSLVQRGFQLLAAGDIALARRFFSRAVTAGNAFAAGGLAQSYDPLILKQFGVRGVVADEARAVELYREAIARGDVTAQPCLDKLLSRR